MTKETLTEKVQATINKYDPIRLLKIGCPADEYRLEIKRIVPILRSTTGINQLHDAAYGVFVNMFDERIAGPKNDYRKLCEELYSLSRKSKK